jgi:G3E family GTPase
MSIVVHVVVGFLGSGKTTLIERLVRHLVGEGRQVALVVNEMADLDVDGASLHDTHGHHDQVSVLGLAGGCVCCDLGEELVAALDKQIRRPGVDTVLLETTGLAALPQVLAGVRRALEANSEHARLGSCIGVLDAARFPEQERRWPAAKVHLDGADVVILNHVDEATEENRRQVLQRARELAPEAAIIEAVHARVDCAAILDTPHLAKDAGDLGIDSVEGFAQTTFLVKRPVDLSKLTSLVRRHRAIDRLKGIVRVDGRDGPQVIQWSAGSREIELTPYRGQVADGFVVAIGRRVRWERFMDGLSACLARRRVTTHRVVVDRGNVH